MPPLPLCLVGSCSNVVHFFDKTRTISSSRIVLVLKFSVVIFCWCDRNHLKEFVPFYHLSISPEETLEKSRPWFVRPESTTLQVERGIPLFEIKCWCRPTTSGLCLLADDWKSSCCWSVYWPSIAIDWFVLLLISVLRGALVNKKTLSAFSSSLPKQTGRYYICLYYI